MAQAHLCSQSQSSASLTASAPTGAMISPLALTESPAWERNYWPWRVLPAGDADRQHAEACKSGGRTKDHWCARCMWAMGKELWQKSYVVGPDRVCWINGGVDPISKLPAIGCLICEKAMKNGVPQHAGIAKWARCGITGWVDGSTLNTHEVTAGHAMATVMFLKDDYARPYPAPPFPPASGQSTRPDVPPIMPMPPRLKDPGTRNFAAFLRKVLKQNEVCRRIREANREIRRLHRAHNTMDKLEARAAAAKKHHAAPGRCPHCRCDACVAAGVEETLSTLPQGQAAASLQGPAASLAVDGGA